jgi:solute carrier family 25 phosphate transporter 3
MTDGKFMGQGPFNNTYYLKSAIAGAICCSLTHGGVVPVDVVKTKMQLDPVTYNNGLLGGARKVMAAEGAGGLLTGLGPTAQGYFIQGWFKFGGVEYFKLKFGREMGEQKAWENRNMIYLKSAAIAEFIADIFLCPYEACRIRLVSNPEYANGMAACAKRMHSELGFIGAFYSGFIPILFKQIPYTMAKFAVQGKMAEAIYKARGTAPENLTKGQNIVVSL